VGVRRRGELAEWLEHDPIRRAEENLARDLGSQRAAVDQEIGRALAAARRASAPDPQRTKEHVCAR
jgi:TPP-dependent pyruvate/acetoin dehydrogenase alpha subunit